MLMNLPKYRELQYHWKSSVSLLGMKYMSRFLGNKHIQLVLDEENDVTGGSVVIPV